MASKKSPVEIELDGRKQDILGLIRDVESRTIPNNHRGTVDRFIRDCRLLVADISESTVFTSRDLGDFTNRYNSLEVVFHTIIQDLP